eukprot:1160237-Pelagomonas_calceolata.AAC.5
MDVKELPQSGFPIARLVTSRREIRGLLNSQGTKVRAVFKPEIEELTISSASAQQRGVAFMACGD